MDWVKLATRAVTSLERIADALEARALLLEMDIPGEEPEDHELEVVANAQRVS